MFAVIPLAYHAAIREAARRASYGWGVVPVTATIGGTEFTTSLFPRDGGYLLPIKLAVRRVTGVGPGDHISASLTFTAPDASPR